MRSLVAVVLPSVLALGAVLAGCRARSFNAEPLGEIPDVVTSAEPLWIPYRVMAGQSYAADPREGRLADLRRVTFDGRSGAPTWHPDSRTLIFERGEPGCAELVEMNLATGETVRLSPTKGSAALGGYVDEPRRLVFLHAQAPSPPCRATFHDGPPRWTPPPADVWVKGPHAEPSRALLPDPATEMDLTVSRGKLVFTSLRDGDPELYGARADGTAIRRLTQAPGYDGGASLSPDGTRLVWHAERHSPPPERPVDGKATAGRSKMAPPKDDVDDAKDGAADRAIAPESLHLFVAGAEGQHARGLGAFGRYDVEPSFLPDSRHVVFSSDYDAAPDETPTFEIYLVDVEAGPRVGGGLPAERVTYHPAYDGQAAVSPDGRWVAFVSTRAAVDQGPGPKGERDIFVARWRETD